MKRAIDWILAGTLFMHFAIIGLYLLPKNPVKTKYRTFLTSYTSPFFSQSWNLFAPRPVTSNTQILVRYIFKNTAHTDTTAWINLTSSLIEKSRSIFFLGANKKLKYLSNSVRNITAHLKHSEQYERQNDIIYLDREFTCLGTANLVNYSSWQLKEIKKAQMIQYFTPQVQYKIIREKIPNYYSSTKTQLKANNLTIISKFTNTMN